MLTLTPEQENLIQTQLATGRYANAEEVLAVADTAEPRLMNFILAPSATRDLDRLSQYFFDAPCPIGVLIRGMIPLNPP
jgi:hypothetical protein